MFFNRYGEEITMLDWIAENSSTLRQTYLRQYLVSTVYLGLDFNPFHGAPHIFETQIFDMNGGQYDLQRWRWSTLGDAHTGHGYILQWLMEVHHTDESEIWQDFDTRPALMPCPHRKVREVFNGGNPWIICSACGVKLSNA